MIEARGFFVGVGTQKSGTSWVSDYLAGHPEIGFSPVKELHFFDSIHTEANRDALRERRRLRRHLRSLRQAPCFGWGGRLALLRDYLGVLRYDPASYRSFLTRAARGRLGGEFTPGYAMLPEEGFAAIDATLSRPRYIAIFRNPADRFWSQVRHESRGAAPPPEAEVTGLLDRVGYAERCDYAGFLGRLERTVDPARVHVMFYEHVFDPARHDEECRRLCAFLGVAHAPSTMERRVNEGRSGGGGARWDRPAVVTRLKPQYAAFAERFGSEALPADWMRDLGA